jgi:segregation and condensation protein A
VFQQILIRAKGQKGQVHEEIWKVADKIVWIRHLLNSQQKIEFEVLFNLELSREELIVTFLALLEMMKMGELRVIKDSLQQKILIVQPT